MAAYVIVRAINSERMVIMALESLLELVRTLSKRIKEHGELLRNNEALTRTALIDPLLRELGWNIEDPAQVIPEFPTDNNEKPDYVLFTSAGPTMIVEAKSLDSPLHEKEKAYKKSPTIQALNYSYNIRETNYFSVTNGRYWEIYDKQRLSDKNKGRISQFNITESPVEAACLKALVLWRPGVEVGIVSPAKVPLFWQGDESTPPAQSPPEPSGEHPPSTDNDWIPLSEFKHQQGDKPPSTLKFPEGKIVEINWWYELVTKTTAQLFENGFLNDSHCPIKRGRRYIVDSSERMLGEAKEIRTVHGAVYVKTKNRASNHIKNALAVIERAGQNPTEFKVRHKRSS